MTNDVIVTDPLGNSIHLPKGFGMHTDENHDENYDDPSTVILKPAMLFKMNDELFYIRSVGWNKTMLIIVNKKHATQWIMNPSNEMLSQILKNSTQLI